MDKLTEKLIGHFKSVYKDKGYTWFDTDEPYNLNIIGVRNESPLVNLFNDFIFVIFRNEYMDWVIKQYNATTKPGVTYLLNPINDAGAAILKEGQYKKLWKVGMHKTQYEALVQFNDAIVIRDNEKNGSFSFTGKEEKGMFGINLHRAGLIETKVVVNRYSAGCQVLQNPNDFKDLMFLVNRSIKQGFANSFSYTLLNSKDFNE